jgi:hypothetical protein
VAEVPSKIVIRTYAPVRAWIVGGTLTLIVLLGGYLLFEYGRATAGFDRLAALREEGRLEREIEARDEVIGELRRAAAALETDRASQAQERAEVARTIGELQAQVARQVQELAFYKGIVVKEANAAEVKVQELRIGRGAQPGRYTVRMTLVQSGRPDSTVSGTVILSVEGNRAGAAARLELPALLPAAQRELPFSFRYFESLNPEIVIPADFRPERLNVEIRSSRRGIAPVTQTLIWTVDAA